MVYYGIECLNGYAKVKIVKPIMFEEIVERLERCLEVAQWDNKRFTCYKCLRYKKCITLFDILCNHVLMERN